ATEDPYLDVDVAQSIPVERHGEQAKSKAALRRPAVAVLKRPAFAAGGRALGDDGGWEACVQRGAHYHESWFASEFPVSDSDCPEDLQVAID
ncbi:unnamed protein product, partial [Symbiodinium sp. CCMP2592]